MRSELIHTFLNALQNNLCQSLTTEEPQKEFFRDSWTYQNGRGGGHTRVLENGAHIEKAGVNVSRIQGIALPPSATQKRPELAGYAFEVMGLSTVIHPRNPFVPTAHMNVRYFQAEHAGDPVWWFGGGFDLTPYYGFEEDCRFWHSHAKSACAVLREDAYPNFKRAADEYFYLPHRKEARGIGGIFFDDLMMPDFESCFEFMRQVGQHFVDAYATIIAKRRHHPYHEKHRAFQAYRRGRYVEFNLVYDRGTLFGLQSQGRTESILISLPPHVTWAYDWTPEAGSEEAKLYTDFLPVREWK